MVKGKRFASSPNKANKPKKGRNYNEISWHRCQCSGSSQIPSQDDLNYHQFLSLYRISWRAWRTGLHIYDTEKRKEVVKDLNNQIYLDEWTCITQLPNGELFCYGERYEVRMLSPGIPCYSSSALYFDNNIYCFGGDESVRYIALSRKFDLEKNRWIDLALLPESACNCHSVIFNGNILVSGYECRNLWLYSIEIDSFSIIPYDFALHKRKFLINAERLYLIEWDPEGGLIYESEDEYYWKPISESRNTSKYCYQMYCLYNKEIIYISTGYEYYQFDLKKKVVLKIK